VLDYWGQQDKDYQIFALSDEEWINVAILCKFLKAFYDVTCVFSGSNYPTTNIYFRGVGRFTRTPNRCLPLWSRVPMFRIMILMILVCINSMLIGLIWEEIMMRNQSLS
ncbi:hypothetical protein Gogos_004434, partial [Gossypium gossypioides]|nr:hypothetical protein [Gossypium gossypioides]